MSEKVELAEPKNLPDGWGYQPSTNTVICRGCLFRFGAEHPDGDGGGWTCPNCGDGNNSAALRASPAEGEAIDRETLIDALWNFMAPGIRQMDGDREVYGQAVDLIVRRSRAAVSPPQREEIAKLVYDAFPFEQRRGLAQKPEWVPNGNSTMQDQARSAADAILALYPAAPQDVDTTIAALLEDNEARSEELRLTREADEGKDIRIEALEKLHFEETKRANEFEAEADRLRAVCHELGDKLALYPAGDGREADSLSSASSTSEQS